MTQCRKIHFILFCHLFNSFSFSLHISYKASALKKKTLCGIITFMHQKHFSFGVLKDLKLLSKSSIKYDNESCQNFCLHKKNLELKTWVKKFNFSFHLWKGFCGKSLRVGKEVLGLKKSEGKAEYVFNIHSSKNSK